MQAEPHITSFGDVAECSPLSAKSRSGVPLRAAFTAWMAERRRRRQIVRELSSHTDRELSELGFSRADLPAIANGTHQR